jgi:beta-lactamase regulating signal transducer with metallopeptidase domain
MNSTLQALGWTLIHFCWQATVIAALYLTADLWLKKARSQTRYLVALATLSSMFLAFVGTLGYETWRSSVASSLPFSNVLTRPVMNVPISTFTTQIEVLANGSITLHLVNLLPWLDGVWMLGVLGLSMRSLGGWLWLQRLRQTTMEKAPEAIQASFQKVCDRLGVRRLPELRISEIIPGPMTIGFLRTLVLLPASTLLALSPEQLEAIFAHELAHVRRADYFWNLVQTLAETLFFFHPAVWWLGKRLREQRELCCDDIAIATCPDPLVYATALFRLEDQRATGQSLAMALDGHQSHATFHSRILRILGETIPQSQTVRLRPLSLLAVCTSLFFFLSPLPKALGVAAQSIPVKQILAVPKEIASVAKHIALESTHRTSAPRTTGRDRHTAEAQLSPMANPSQAETKDSTTEPLEYEIHRKFPKIHGKVHAVHGENTPDETVQMLALGSQLRSSPAAGVAHAKGFLMGNDEISLKRQVIFVLFQHPSPDAQQLIADLFRGTLGSELQLETIHMVGSLQRRQYSPTLVELYRESTDSEVKRAVISALFVSHDAASLLSLVKSERDSDMRRAIVSYLAMMHDKPAIEYVGALLN